MSAPDRPISPARAIGHLIGLVWVAALTLVLVYVSRFWIWQAPWDRQGLFGIRELSPAGDALRRSLRGTWGSEFDIVIWGAGAIVLLSLFAWLTSKIAAQFSALRRT
ncbi:MAG: hypothetical protein AAFO79_06235 [Pseudomonadota bacterium]